MDGWCEWGMAGAGFDGEPGLPVVGSGFGDVCEGAGEPQTLSIEHFEGFADAESFDADGVEGLGALDGEGGSWCAVGWLSIGREEDAVHAHDESIVERRVEIVERFDRRG